MNSAFKMMNFALKVMNVVFNCAGGDGALPQCIAGCGKPLGPSHHVVSSCFLTLSHVFSSGFSRVLTAGAARYSGTLGGTRSVFNGFSLQNDDSSIENEDSSLEK